MKAKIHPKWYPAATVVCACGNTWTTGATIPEIRTDICSACHPFYTGEQRIVDTEGQIDRFLKKLQVRTNMAAEAEARAAIKAAPANPTLQDLGLDKRTINSLKEAGVEFANELLHKLVDEGEKCHPCHRRDWPTVAHLDQEGAALSRLRSAGRRGRVSSLKANSDKAGRIARPAFFVTFHNAVN